MNGEWFAQREELYKELLLDCYRLAQTSPDPSTQNAAFILDEVSAEVLMSDINRFPDGVSESSERWERPAKYQYIEHAERNVVYGCAKEGIKTNGKIMLVCWAACTDCARAIIQSGVKTLITHRAGDNHTWEESIKVADQMMKEAGIQLIFITGKLDLTNEIQVLRNGNLFSP